MTVPILLAFRPFLVAAVLALHLFAPSASHAAPGFTPIEVTTTPIENFQIGSGETRFGEFEFRGGVIAASSDPRFGGFSGLAFLPGSDEFLSISDIGYWLRGTVVRSNGWLTGLSATSMASMLNAEGRPLGAKRNADAEGLRLGTDQGRAVAYVSFEQISGLKAYPLEPDIALSRPLAIRLPKSATGIRRNRGFEALAVAPADSAFKGSPILITERTLDKAGNLRAFVVRGPLAGTFSVRRSDDFDATDADFLPNGDLLLLERKVVMPLGVKMRLRRIDAATIRPGATVDGPVVLSASMANRIDNMEGLAVTSDADGRARITLVSDDNYSFIQRTMLLEFVWLGPSKSAEAE